MGSVEFGLLGVLCGGHGVRSGFDAHLLYVAPCGVKYIIPSQEPLVGQFED
jgi:hypothetical protein